ncbi:MAG TPA: hypothetical protein VNS22_07605 [Geminicoccus sp.]|uniref:hypothetical protein n=1 Tax=Geminicoccus sp. TaxID=2024832 RepID=UPI002BC7BFCB|nr:hypothetical protein [Geminicoccus sp.]HWL68237.1 hypothetical protein [Geminicoccus sp.]
MPSSAADRTTFEVRAILIDAYDGMIRVLNDAQRFGLELVATLLEEAGNEAELRMVLVASAPVTPEVLRARLARHSCLRQVEVSRRDRTPLPLAA